MASSSLLSVGAIVEPEQNGSYIFNMTSVAFDDLYYLYEIYVDQEIVDAAPDTIQEVYFPTYMPKGFLPLYRTATVDGASAAWESETGSRISYSQGVFSDDEWRLYISYDAWSDVAGVFDLGDFEVFRFKSSHEIIYLWSDRRYYFELRADADVDEETMQKIFESIEWMPDEAIRMN